MCDLGPEDPISNIIGPIRRTTDDAIDAWEAIGID